MESLPGQPEETVEVQDTAEPPSQITLPFRPTLAPLEPLKPLSSSTSPNADCGKSLQAWSALPVLVTPETKSANGQPFSPLEAWSIGDATETTCHTSAGAHMLLLGYFEEPSGRESSVANGSLLHHGDEGSCSEMAEGEVKKQEGAPPNVLPEVERLANGLTPGEDALQRYNLMLVCTLLPNTSTLDLKSRNPGMQHPQSENA